MNDFLSIALSQWNVTEVKGEKHNPEVVKYFHETGRTDINDDETSWCDAFADWVVMKAGAQPSPGLNARAWLDVGEVVEDPRLGDIVVLWREKPESWEGHVGFFIGQNEKHVYLLGGNQSNRVTISAFPVKRILGYRRIEIPQVGKVLEISPDAKAEIISLKPTVADILQANDNLSPEEQEELLNALAPEAEVEVADIFHLIEKLSDVDRDHLRALMDQGKKKPQSPVIGSVQHQSFA